MRKSILLAAAAALAAVALAGAARALAAKDPKADYDTPPDWLRKPNSDQLQAVWPAKLHGPGKAVLKCRVNVQGLLEACVVAFETPPDVGVGAAALLLAPNFVMKPAMKGGQPVVSSVNIPVNLMLEPGALLVGPMVQSMLHPMWIKAPTRAEMQAARPKAAGAVVGHVAMRCTVLADGGLKDCVVLTEAPARSGFGAAAKGLAPRFRALVDPAGMGRNKVQATVALVFEPPGAEPPALSGLVWRTRPNPVQAASVFPDKAQKAGLKTGRAVIACTLKADGTLDGCGVSAEDPPGQDFGPAALRLVPLIAFCAWTEDGRPVDGAHLLLPIRLNLGEEAAAPAAH